MADDLGFRPSSLDRFARAAHLMDSFILHDKARRQDALRAAQARGLDGEELRKAVTASVMQARVNRRRMNPSRHAATLLRETSLSFREIASITGLDIYSVVGLKLKLRATS
jgi:predicted kinase